MIAHTLLILVLIELSLSQSFNNSFPDWPEYCCNLELSPHSYGHPLPKDTITAGSIDGKRYGFAIDRQQNSDILIISEDPHEYPIRPLSDCDSDESGSSYEVITNPNKCAIGWYETRYESESFSSSSGSRTGSRTRAADNDKRIVSPAYNGYLFATREYGEDQLWSGTFKDGESVTCFNSSYHSKRTITPGTMVMFVDCLKSLATMADAKLVSIKVNEREMDSLRNNAPVVYYKRTFVNTGILPQRQDIQFTAERTNTMFVSVSESFSPTKCDSQETTFSSLFGSQMRSYAGLKTNALFMGMNAKLGIDTGAAFDMMQQRSANACSRNSDGNSSPMHRENKRYSFSNEIITPAASITTVSATSFPFRGQIPFTMTYELGSPASMDQRLKQALEFYRIGDRTTTTSRGSVLVHFDGAMVVDSGNEIEVEVTAVPIHNPLSGYLLNSKQTVFPSL